MEITDEYCEFPQEIKDEMIKLISEYYWRCSAVKFTEKGVEVISEDQGGYPFTALKIEMTGDTEKIGKACLEFVRVACG